MFPASTNGGGICTNSVPDVCQTPTPGGTVPIPYPNIGQCTSAVNTATKVMIGQRPVIHKMSEIPMSSGDEAGVSGGVKSGTFMDKVTFAAGSSKITIEGQQCVYHTSSTLHDGASFNTGGVQAAPSQTNVLVSP